MTKVIFLDIDGVLCNDEYLDKERAVIYQNDAYYRYCRLDPRCVNRLNKITSLTGAAICLSSTWRIGDEDRFEVTKKYLASEGIDAAIIGRTPKLYTYRGLEIQAWLDENEVDSFVIIDDSSDMEHLMPYLVETDTILGLQEKDIDTAVKILNERKKETNKSQLP